MAAELGTPGDAADSNVKTDSLEFIRDVTLNLAVEFGRASMSVKEVLALQKGSVIEIEKLAGEPLDIRVNNTLVAHGEVVVVNEKFGVRVTEIMSPVDFQEPAFGLGENKK